MIIDINRINTVRNYFERASKEFNFTFISPYCVDKDAELYAFGYIPEYGSLNGVVFSLVSPPDFKSEDKIKQWCKNHEVFYSCLNIEIFKSYDTTYFRDLLDDWRISEGDKE